MMGGYAGSSMPNGLMPDDDPGDGRVVGWAIIALACVITLLFLCL